MRETGSLENNSNRLMRERKTIRAMLQIYCNDAHSPQQDLCEDCSRLLTYAWQRLEKCPFQAGKPTCARCPIHCYQKLQREKIRAVMRHAGPRMLIKHPYLTVAHLFDDFRKAPVLLPKSEK